LPIEVSKIYEKFFSKMKRSLNVLEFIRISGQLYNSLSIPEKNLIINSKKHKKPASEEQHFRVLLLY